MPSLLGIKWVFPSWNKKFKAAREEINLFIAANMQHNRAMLFDKEGAHNGRPKWDTLRLRNGMILSRRGTLRKSIGPNNSGRRPAIGPDSIVRFQAETITIGTKLFYARMMNDGTVKLPGGVLRPKRAKALMIPLPAGKSATEGAKELRPGSTGKRDIQARLTQVEDDLRTAHDPDRRAKLTAIAERLRKHMATGPKSQRFIFRKSVKIKPRPFDTWNNQDQAELESALLAKLIEVLSR